MTSPDVEWDRYPITMLVPHVAAVYGMKADTLRKQIRLGDSSLPEPFMDRPWRWRKSEVRRHYERLTVRDVRAARRLRRREQTEQAKQEAIPV